MIRSEDTICAPATGTSGAIAIIRLSGDDSIDICSKIFSPADKKQILTELKGYTICFGEIIDGVEIIDEVLVSVFRAPQSYTGENGAEISCHASQFIIRRILELLVKNGARTAKPGEFTQRAFLNGKLDLSQAEAVADLIASTTRSSHRIALNQMRGGFSSEIGKLRSELLNFASLIELELDFGEEDVEFADRGKLKSIIVKVKEITDRLSESFSLGNAVKNGIPVAIIGKPNSGKSTLLNALLMEERAIVSEIPGTTRDSIEDTVIIEGIEYRFIDTAGLRETTDVVENMGIQRTHEKISQAAVVLFLDEISEAAEDISERINVTRRLIEGSDKHLVILINKTDTSSVLRQSDFSEKISLLPNEELLFISAKEKTGLDILRKKLTDVVNNSKFSKDDVIITNSRHYEALVNVSESLARVLSGLDNNIPEDFIAIDIRQAIYFLGEITGEISSDEILGNIFKNFCIGK